MDRDVVAQKQDSRMRLEFERVMYKELGIPDRYQNVAVLIVRWENDLDKELKCWREVEELDELLRGGFRYDSQIAVLNNARMPQNQLDAAVTSFVHEHDGPHRSHLLIVYYTGHGILRPVNGSENKELIISGTQSSQRSATRGETRYLPEARWDQAETSLRSAEADVLTILDCCFAAGAVKGKSEHTRTFELLAATGRDLTTPRPGPLSYTRALIDCLQEKLNENEGTPFNTFELNTMIREKRDWITTPHVYNRMGYSRHINLAPLPEVKKSDFKNSPEVRRNAGYLNLRIAFAELSDLKDSQVETLATCLSDAAKGCELGVSDIHWVGFEPTQNSKHFQSLIFVVRVYYRFRKALLKLREKKRQEQLKRKADDDGSEGMGTPRRAQMSLEEVAEKVLSSRSVGSGPPTPGSLSRAATPIEQKEG